MKHKYLIPADLVRLRTSLQTSSLILQFAQFASLAFGHTAVLNHLSVDGFFAVDLMISAMFHGCRMSISSRYHLVGRPLKSWYMLGPQ